MVHDCLIRTICEVAETPHSGDGIIGDVFNLLLSPVADVKVELVLTLVTPKNL